MNDEKRKLLNSKAELDAVLDVISEHLQVTGYQKLNSMLSVRRVLFDDKLGNYDRK